MPNYYDGEITFIGSAHRGGHSPTHSWLPLLALFPCTARVCTCAPGVVIQHVIASQVLVRLNPLKPMAMHFAPNVGST